jgi:hypothetical protein
VRPVAQRGRRGADAGEPCGSCHRGAASEACRAHPEDSPAALVEAGVVLFVCACPLLRNCSLVARKSFAGAATPMRPVERRAHSLPLCTSDLACPHLVLFFPLSLSLSLCCGCVRAAAVRVRCKNGRTGGVDGAAEQREKGQRHNRRKGRGEEKGRGEGGTAWGCGVRLGNGLNSASLRDPPVTEGGPTESA